MSVLSTASIVGIALKTINGAISLYKKKVPSWEQSEAKKLIERQHYLQDLYETEKRKPRYDDTKTPEENKNARSLDRMLNARDLCISHGEKLVQRLGQL